MAAFARDVVSRPWPTKPWSPRGAVEWDVEMRDGLQAGSDGTVS